MNYEQNESGLRTVMSVDQMSHLNMTTPQNITLLSNAKIQIFRLNRTRPGAIIALPTVTDHFSLK